METEQTDGPRTSRATAPNDRSTAGKPDRRTERPTPTPEVLIVGTFAGGGIHQYIDEQTERLRTRLSVETHDMTSPPPGEGAGRFLRGILTAAIALLRFLVRDRPAVVHVHTSHRFSFYRASPYVLFARYVWRAPVIVHIHGSSFDEFVGTDSRVVAAIQERVFDAATEIIVLSEYWEEVVSERADPDRIRVLPNAVDPSRYPVDTDSTSKSGSDELPHIVFVSNLIERKGVNELVSAIETLGEAHPGAFRVTIAGDGVLSDRVEQLARATEEVTYLGYVSESRKQSLLASGDIYVLPTYAEGLPIAMLEGMAGENAVVATTVGSIPEVIDERQGILVSPGDSDALVEALERLVTSPERRRSMGARNRQAVEEHYSWDGVIEELVALYASHTDRRP